LHLFRVNNVSRKEQTFFLASPSLIASSKEPVSIQMSGIETVKVIVEAEKEAAKVLADADTRAREIRKRLDSLVQEQREEAIRAARKEATAIVANAQSAAITEGQVFEKDAQTKMHDMLDRASARKGLAVDKLVSMLMELRA